MPRDTCTDAAPPPAEAPPAAASSSDESDFWNRVAVNASFVANVCLFTVKLFALISDFTMVLLASTVDSVLDLLSGSIIFMTHRLMNKHEPEQYPAGKSRFEPIGIVVFATVMATSALQVVTMSALSMSAGFNDQEKAGREKSDAISWTSLGVVLAVIVTKASLFLFCRTVNSPFAQTYADDHRNDVLSNGFAFAILFVVRDYPAVWYLDDIGAVCIALYILFNWIQTGFEQVKQLAAHGADEDNYAALKDAVGDFIRDAHPALAGALTDNAAADAPGGAQPASWSASPSAPLAELADLKAYHFGPGLIAEVDLQLPAALPLERSQPFCDALQKKVESLEFVERCFVTFDCRPRQRVISKRPSDNALSG